MKRLVYLLSVLLLIMTALYVRERRENALMLRAIRDVWEMAKETDRKMKGLR